MKKLWFLLAIGFLASCERQEEGELITTVELHLQQDSINRMVSFEDLDGPGGQDPSFPDTLILKTGVSTAELLLWNKSLQIPESITDEVREESNDHLVCWEWIPDYTDDLPLLTLTRLDKDSQGLELGLQISIDAKMGSNSQGKIRCTLKHQPGIKTGACALGETDVEVDFPVRW